MLKPRLVLPLLLPLAAACGGPSLPADRPQTESADERWADAEKPVGSGGDTKNDAESHSQAPGDGNSSGAEGTAARGNNDSAKPLGNTVAETRTTQVIQQVVVRHRQQVRDCYEKEQKRSPGLMGTLTIQFKLDSKGNVSSAELNADRSTLTQPTVVLCAINAIKKIKFPPSSRGFESSVNYPFDFKP